jgi:sugar lactone lactonase YvrE
LSARDKMLVIMKDGKTTGAHKLDKDMFRQPEGLCFMPDGTMLISNEAQESTANILRFAYKPAAK